MADVLIDRARNPRPFETTGVWPKTLVKNGYATVPAAN